MAKTKPKLIPLREIRIDGGTQPREEIDEATVEAFRECLDRGDEFPPADVFQDGADIWLADGFHRWHAAHAAEHEQMECTVHKGTKQDAQWFAARANQTHGLRRSNADKAKAVRMALGHPNAKGKSDRAIAEHVGVGAPMVGKYRAEGATVTKLQSTKRTGRDGRTIDTSKIGKTRKKGEKPPKPAKSSQQSQTASGWLKLQKANLKLLGQLVRGIETQGRLKECGPELTSLKKKIGAAQ